MIHPIAYNPGCYTDAELEAIFVARKKTFDYFLNSILANEKGEAPQHHLIIGQRGMGKSTLLHRLAAELRKASHKEKFLPLTFPEELYNVTSLAKFWLTSLDAFADALEARGAGESLRRLDNDIDRLAKSAVRAKEIFRTFLDWAEELNCRPVLLIDNINLIFSRLKAEERQSLRGCLMQPDAPILLGGSVTEISYTEKYTAPFYDFFQKSYLRKLSYPEAVAVLRNLAVLQDNQVALTSLNQHPARLQTLYVLTGGSPRAMTLLYPIISNGFSGELYRDLEGLLDSVTPLYKARFEKLTAAQMQTVLDAVALEWKPVNLEQLREVTGMQNSQLSPQLKRLTESGWLSAVETPETRGKSYEVAERFFNVWYLMRRGKRRDRHKIKSSIEFLEDFYKKNPLEVAEINRVTLADSLSVYQNPRDIDFLAEVSRHIKANNIGLLQNCLERHLTAKEKNGSKIEEFWYEFALLILENPITTPVLQTFQTTGYREKMRPYYEAIAALAHEKSDLYVNSIPAEMRAVTREIMQKIRDLKM